FEKVLAWKKVMLSFEPVTSCCHLSNGLVLWDKMVLREGEIARSLVVIEVDDGDSSTRLECRSHIAEVTRAVFEMVKDVADKNQIHRVNRKLRAIGPCQDEFRVVGRVHVHEAVLHVLKHLRLHIDRIDLSRFCHGSYQAPCEVAGA